MVGIQSRSALLEPGAENWIRPIKRSSGRKVEKIDDIMKYGVMVTPALVIDEQVKASGRIPSAPEIVSWIMTAAAKASA
jgi:molecular chaperone DnaK (HSP70)